MRGALLVLATLSIHGGTAVAVGPKNALNDTGIGKYGDQTDTSLSSEPASAPAQDARMGRDAKASTGTLPKTGGGIAGFDFTALDSAGQPTSPLVGASPHPCVRDNVTGLVWEVRTGDGGMRDKNWTYTWYDSNSASNGGSPGSASGVDRCRTPGRCDTEKYVADVNALSLCGYNNWRVPTVKELESIMDFGRPSPTPSIDPTYFPNSVAAGYWSSTATASATGSAWYVLFLEGNGVSFTDKTGANGLRLVRAETVAGDTDINGTLIPAPTGPAGARMCEEFGGPSPGSGPGPCGSYQIPIGNCSSGMTGANAISKAWMYVLEEYAPASPRLGNSIRWGMQRDSAMIFRFKTGAVGAFPNTLQQGLNQPLTISYEEYTGLGVFAPRFVTLSETKCDFDYSKTLASGVLNGCYKAMGLGDGLLATITPTGADSSVWFPFCQLKPNTTYYVNIRYEDARTVEKRGIISCPVGGTCGQTMGIN